MKKDNFYFFLSLLPAFLLVILLTSEYHISLGFIPLSLKLDSLIIVLGNFMIAYYISLVINKKHKKDELKIDNCFKELDTLLNLLTELRNLISKKAKTLDDDKIRYSSLISLQISLIEKYKFIENTYIKKLKDNYYKFEEDLTGENEINEEYKHSLLQLERIVFNIKSNIL